METNDFAIETIISYYDVFTFIPTLLAMPLDPTAAATSVASSGGIDMSSILGNVAGGGVGGAILMAVIGLIKTQMSKSNA
jgi:hypothetical protein